MALGIGLLVLILLALAVRGCLNAREDRAIRDYVRDLSSIITETSSTSNAFFERLEDRGTLSVTGFVDEVNADRSAMDAYEARIEALDVPDDMAEPHEAVEITYEMRASAMNEIAQQMRTALGEQGRERAVRRITNQMSVLYASDRVFELLGRIPAQRELEERGMVDLEVPSSQFVPDETTWLEEDAVGSALGVTGAAAGEADDDLTHGTGLLSASINGIELDPEGTTVITDAASPEMTVQLQNQGEAEESDVEVAVTIGDQPPLTSTVATVSAGATEAVSIPLTPAPSGLQEIQVEIAPVPGEQVLENNTSTYEVDFG